MEQNLPPLAHLQPDNTNDAETKSSDERKQDQDVAVVVVRSKSEQLHEHVQPVFAFK